MVFSKHLYMVILSYILLIIAVAGAGIALIITHTALILGCLFLIISLFFIRALVKQLNKFNAKIRIFLDAMEDKESMILFNEQSADKEMNALSHSLNRINELLATTKSQSRVQENFYHSLLEEVPNGVLAWNSEKRVLFVNGAALRLLGVESIIFLRQLEEQYPILKDFITHGNVENSFLLQSNSKKQLSLSMNRMKLNSETINPVGYQRYQ